MKLPIMIKVKEIPDARGVIGLSKGHIRSGYGGSVPKSRKCWRQVRSLEGEIYANGITFIKDLSKL